MLFYKKMFPVFLLGISHNSPSLVLEGVENALTVEAGWEFVVVWNRGGKTGFTSTNSKDSKERVRAGGAQALEDGVPVTVTSVIMFALRGVLSSLSKSFPHTQNDVTTFYLAQC